MDNKKFKLLLKFEEVEDWKNAIRINHELIADNPNDHFLLTSLSSNYYESQDYRNALKYSKKAVSLEPYCPLVLWDYAGVLYALGNDELAMRIWQYFIDMGINRIAFEECGEGIRWAKTLINDSRFRIGKTYIEMKKITEGKKYLKAHLKNRKRGLPSLFTKREVEKLLKS